jgi:esterase/lipase superfamily enzyme
MNHPSNAPRRLGLRCAKQWVAALMLLVPIGSAEALSDQDLRQLIVGFHTGNVNLFAFTPEARHMIIDQTEGTLLYSELVQLAPIERMELLASKENPAGTFYQYRIKYFPSYSNTFRQVELTWEFAIAPDGLVSAFSFFGAMEPVAGFSAVIAGGSRAEIAQLPATATSQGHGNEGVRPFEQVRVFYATDRKPTGDTTPARFFGSDRSPIINFGHAIVSIPHDHRMGELESPSMLAFWRLNFSEDPEENVVLMQVSPIGPDSYFRELQRVGATAEYSSAFIFIHGYNVTFKDAARRTAQIAYDLKFPGVPVFYSWPSRGTAVAYAIDETNIEWTRANLERFLSDFVARTNIKHIYLIAHSMGNRALTAAFANLVTQKPQLRHRFKEIILAAPDIDAEVFTRDIAPKLVGTGTAKTPVTVYASSRDRALRASKKFHGYRRAGDTDRGLALAPGLVTIDATAVESDFLGHSYFGEVRSVIADIYYLIRGESPCNRHGLAPIRTKIGKACRIMP